MAAFGKRIVFLHVPKTGGTWAVHAMQAAGVELVPGATHAGLHDIPTGPTRFRLAFVREPFGWYRSWWAHRHTFQDWREEPLDRFGRGTFEDLIRKVTTQLPGFAGDVFEQFIGPPEDPIDFVGRYERLSEDLVKALKIAGEPFDEDVLRHYPPVNVSSRSLSVRCSPEIAERLKVSERGAYERFYPELLLDAALLEKNASGV